MSLPDCPYRDNRNLMCERSWNITGFNLYCKDNLEDNLCVEGKE